MSGKYIMVAIFTAAVQILRFKRVSGMVHSVEYYMVGKKEQGTDTRDSKDLESILLSEGNQAQRTMECDSLDMKCPQEADAQMREADSWLPRAAGKWVGTASMRDFLLE